MKKPVAFLAPVRQADGRIIHTVFKTEDEATAATEKFEKEHAELHAAYKQSAR